MMAEQKLDCSPGGEIGGRGDVLKNLERIHVKMHSGAHYGFEQSIWCDSVAEIKKLRQMLNASHHPACEHRDRGIGAPGCICKTVRAVPPTPGEGYQPHASGRDRLPPPRKP